MAGQSQDDKEGEQVDIFLGLPHLYHPMSLKTWEIVLWKLEMRCLKSSPNQLFVACNIFGVRYQN